VHETQRIAKEISYENNFMIEEEGTRPMLPFPESVLIPQQGSNHLHFLYFVLKFEDHENVTIFKVEF
jgi:hypothetical protein